MIAIKIAAVVVGLIAVFMTFGAEMIVTKLLHKEATLKAVLRVKYVALALAAAAAITVFLVR